MGAKRGAITGRHRTDHIRPNIAVDSYGPTRYLTIVFAALAVSRWIEHQTSWPIRKFVKTARRYRTIEIQAGPHTIIAADPPSADLRVALDQIHGRSARTKLSQVRY
ncbi:MAG: hypothetical protein ACM3ML_17495 [Micromonosporaceae bacterium]